MNVIAINNNEFLIVQNKKLVDKLAKRTSLLSKLKYDIDTVGNGDVLIKNAFAPTDDIIDFMLFNITEGNYNKSYEQEYDEKSSMIINNIFKLNF
mgnify:CR=1 FL=1